MHKVYVRQWVAVLLLPNESEPTAMLQHIVDTFTDSVEQQQTTDNRPW